MSAQPQPYLTPEEYLAIERAAPTRSEYHSGQMYAMSGASLEHNRITTNVIGALFSQFRGRDCEAFAADMRVRDSSTGLYTYPDIVIVCGEAELEDDHKDTLLNPTVIMEVLSPSTESYDRGTKWANYQRLPSLREYVLSSQNEPRVERYFRQDDGDWLLTVRTEPTDSLNLPTINASLALADIYERVSFPQPPTPAAEG